jgi:hypothetical protein
MVDMCDNAEIPDILHKNCSSGENDPQMLGENARLRCKSN